MDELKVGSCYKVQVDGEIALVKVTKGYADGSWKGYRVVPVKITLQNGILHGIGTTRVQEKMKTKQRIPMYGAPEYKTVCVVNRESLAKLLDVLNIPYHCDEVERGFIAAKCSLEKLQGLRDYVEKNCK